MQINSKREFYALWEAGLLGNKPRTWRELQPALDARLARYGIREIGAAGGGKFELADHGSLRYVTDRWTAEGRRWILDDGAPNHLSQLQGEVCRTTRGLEGYLGVRTGVSMREAIARKLLIPRTPLVTRLLMRHFIDGASLDDIDVLLERYPDATIELCAYSVNVGHIRGRNTIIWEVRNY